MVCLGLEKLPKMIRITFLLISAENNDMAEGLIDDALEKYLISEENTSELQ